MITTCLSNLSFISKPSATEAAIISASIADCSQTLSFDEFVQSVGNGQSFTLATEFTNNDRKSANCSSIQILAADIDDGNLNLNQLVELTNNFDLPAAIVYESFSSSEVKRKYRVMFLSSNPIDNHQVALAILRKIKLHFNSDPAIIDLARILYGTTSDKIKLTNEVYFDANLLDLSNFLVKYKPPEEAIMLPVANKKLAKKDKEFVELIKHRIAYSLQPRYMTVFHSARLMAKTAKFDEQTIVSELIAAIKAAKRFQDYDRSDAELVNLIKNSINWTITNCKKYDI